MKVINDKKRLLFALKEKTSGPLVVAPEELTLVEESFQETPTPVDSRPYKVYTALLSQSGTNAPVATVLENTLGGDVVWSREDAGIYIANSNSLFTENKTTIDFGILNLVDAVNGQIIISDEVTPNENEFQIYTRDINFSNVDGLSNIKIEIRVYN